MQRPLCHKYPPGDSQLFRDRFERDFGASNGIRPGHPRAEQQYNDWLRLNGIDPYTGEMTETGIGLLRTLLNERNNKNHVLRTLRKRPKRIVPDVRHTRGR